MTQLSSSQLTTMTQLSKSLTDDDDEIFYVTGDDGKTMCHRLTTMTQLFTSLTAMTQLSTSPIDDNATSFPSQMKYSLNIFLVTKITLSYFYLS
jgi:hypothetical protein